jgi:hypothetical protein
MLKRIVMQLSGHGMARFTQALASLKVRLCKLVSNLRVSFILASLSVANLFNRLVKTLSNFKVLLVSLTTAVQLTKAALKRVVIISGQIGQQLLTIARQTLQRVNLLRKKGK